MVSIRRPPCNLDLQLGRSLDKSVQDSGVILKSFRSRFMTSLNVAVVIQFGGYPLQEHLASAVNDSVIWHTVDMPGPAQADKLEPR